MRWARRVTTYWEDEKYTNLDGKFEEKKPLGGQRQRWKNNIKMDFKQTGCDNVD
jgi:hypothetical protein